MFDNLGELIKTYPIGTKIYLSDEERDDYADGKFIVDGYVYEEPERWYPAHKLWDNRFEVYKG